MPWLLCIVLQWILRCLHLFKLWFSPKHIYLNTHKGTWSKYSEPFGWFGFLPITLLSCSSCFLFPSYISFILFLTQNVALTLLAVWEYPVGPHPLLQMAFGEFLPNHSGSLPRRSGVLANTTCSLLITWKWFYCSPHRLGLASVRLAHWSKYIEVFIVGDRIPGSCSLSSHMDSKSLVQSPSVFITNRKNWCHAPSNTMPWKEHSNFSVVFLPQIYKSWGSIR